MWQKFIVKPIREILHHFNDGMNVDYEPWLCQKCGIREVVIACPDHCQECEDGYKPTYLKK